LTIRFRVESPNTNICMYKSIMDQNIGLRFLKGLHINKKPSKKSKTPKNLSRG